MKTILFYLVCCLLLVSCNSKNKLYIDKVKYLTQYVDSTTQIDNQFKCKSFKLISKSYPSNIIDSLIFQFEDKVNFRFSENIITYDMALKMPDTLLTYYERQHMTYTNKYYEYQLKKKKEYEYIKHQFLYHNGTTYGIDPAIYDTPSLFSYDTDEQRQKLGQTIAIMQDSIKLMNKIKNALDEINYYKELPNDVIQETYDIVYTILNEKNKIETHSKKCFVMFVDKYIYVSLDDGLMAYRNIRNNPKLFKHWKI